MSRPTNRGMGMDFFEAQDRARAKSRYLIFLFVVAVVCIVALLTVVTGFVLKLAEVIPPEESIWSPHWMIPLAAGTTLFIAAASLTKLFRLRGGGKAVAESLGGTPVALETTDPDERKLLNVVEEMALASGVPVPEVFVMRGERGINAFAAGHTLDDAAIGVTEGCMRRLDRDELQGVIAHEFSHILWGDMRINLRLIGVIFGIVCITYVGRSILRSMAYQSRSSRSGRNAGGTVFLFLLGITVLVIGSLGVVFGRMIQSAVSRQREFLADAAAVQFTRNPQGIAGALKKIGGAYSKISAPHAEDSAHLFFSSAIRSSMSTHPPLRARIRAIDPSWDGKFVSSGGVGAPSTQSVAGGKAAATSMGGLDQQMIPGVAIGLAAERQERHARSLRSRIREDLEDWIHQPLKAAALTFAMILEEDPKVRKAELDAVRNLPGIPSLELMEEGFRKLGSFSKQEHYEILELALGAIRNNDRAVLERLPGQLETMARADTEVTLREYLILYMVRRHLKGRQEPVSLLEERGSAKDYAGAIGSILSALAHLQSPEDPAQAKRAFEEGLRPAYELNAHVKFFPEARSEGEKVVRDLERLSRSRFAIRRQVLDAAGRIVRSNRTLSDDEAAMIRLFSAALGCPMPPVDDLRKAA